MEGKGHTLLMINKHLHKQRRLFWLLILIKMILNLALFKVTEAFGKTLKQQSKSDTIFDLETAKQSFNI